MKQKFTMKVTRTTIEVGLVTVVADSFEAAEERVEFRHGNNSLGSEFYRDIKTISEDLCMSVESVEDYNDKVRPIEMKVCYTNGTWDTIMVEIPAVVEYDDILEPATKEVYAHFGADIPAITSISIYNSMDEENPADPDN